MSVDQHDVSRRRFFGLATGGAMLLPLLGRSARAQGSAKGARTVMYEHTFLKAKPALRDDLARYIELNWFVMDAAGLAQGIFTSYELLRAVDENPKWDLVMVVGYPQPEGYSDERTKAKFLEIRAAHKEVRVGGRGLKELGDIVEHHRLRIVPERT